MARDGEGCGGGFAASRCPMLALPAREFFFFTVGGVGLVGKVGERRGSGSCHPHGGIRVDTACELTAVIRLRITVPIFI